MEQIDSQPRPQTIVIDRKERRIPRGLLLLLGASIFANMTMCARSAAPGLGRLDERYVAGSSGIADPEVAIVEIKGAIVDSEVEYVLKQIRQAREDTQVKAVVLRVDSPGGTVGGSDQIWRELETLRTRGKPVVASFGGMAASGGYYVSANTDLIVAEPTTLTGSIGVKLELIQVSELMKKVGVSSESITTGAFKDTGSMYRPMTEEERARWKVVIDDAYNRFLRIVAQGRKLPLKDARALADGKVYTAKEALDSKLIDRIGYLDDAIALVQTKAGLVSARVIRYSKPMSFSDAISSLGTSSNGNGAGIRVDVDFDSLLKLRGPQLLFMLD
jgi:protease-4